MFIYLSILVIYTVTTPGYQPLTDSLIIDKKAMHRSGFILQKSIDVA